MSKAKADVAKQIYRFDWDAGRQGDVGGMFVSDEVEMKRLFGKARRVDFGECLGKHSHVVFDDVTRKDFDVVAATPEIVAWFAEHVRSTGRDAREYISVYCKKCACWMDSGGTCEHKPWAAAGLPGDG